MVEGDRGTSAAMRAVVPAFVRDLSFGALPADVVAQVQRCLLDLIGVAAAGSRTQSARIANAYAATQLCGRERDARILFDGRRAGLAGAAFAGAATIDALDAHDGHVLTKGHAGVAILPSVIHGPWVTTASTVPLKGTATDNVTRVTWSADWGGSGTASGTRAWTIPTIGLQIGKNVVTVTAMTADGRIARQSVTLTYRPLRASR